MQINLSGALNKCLIRAIYICKLSNFLKIIPVSRKRETKMFSVISSTKLAQFRQNLINSFLNKSSAIKSRTYAPPHLNDISTLPCATCNAHCAHDTIELLEKETPEVIPSLP